MKILVDPHLLQCLGTWLGKLESNCSETCPEVPPCPSSLLFSADYKCIPGLHTCNSRRRVSPQEHQGTQLCCHDQPSGRPREGVCLGMLPQRPCSSPKSWGLCSQNSEGKSLSLDTGSKEQLQEATARNTADHLVAQKLSSWRSLALTVRFWVGWERWCQSKAAAEGPHSRSAEWSGN